MVLMESGPAFLLRSFDVRINKVINNNMVSALGADGEEILYRGPGIGYGKRPGEKIDERRIEQSFVLSSASLVRRFHEISLDIDSSLIDVCFDVIGDIKRESRLPLSDSLYVMLTDHVYNLIDRLRQNIVFDNSVLWNLKSIYPEEYQLAKKAVKTLQERLPYGIDDSEASFVTLHIVNAEIGGDMHDTYQFTTFIEDILDIVASNLDIELNEDNYRINRFLVHLRYLFGRLASKDAALEAAPDVDVEGLIADALEDGYPEIQRAVGRIVDYVKMSKGYELSREEQLYLLIHLVQIFRTECGELPRIAPGEPYA